jgi:UDP-N-acetylmuramoyl-tripeptide--D-alanyl-D-alanine ligase
MIAPLSLAAVAATLGALLQQGDARFTRVATDSRQLQPGDLFVALRGANFDGHDFLHTAANAGACGLVVEEFDASLSLPQLVVRDTLLALGQIARLNRDAFAHPLIAITGSSGKTTVKTMVADILRECGSVLMTQGNFNNHIGVPLTLLQIARDHEFAVIEMGASSIGEIGYLCTLAKPDVALVNNVMPAHIAGFGSLENVALAKGEIYLGLAAQGTAVINIDDAFAPQWLAQMQQQTVITVSLTDASADCFARNISATAECTSFTLVVQQDAIDINLPAPGEHNIRNALAAAACAFAVGASLSHIKQGLEKFVPVSGRLSRQHTPGGALVIDDSYNANPGSVRAAIQVLAAQPGQKVLVLGDMGELGEHAELLHAEIGRFAQAQQIHRLLTVGSLSRHASEAFGESGQHFASQAELMQVLNTLVDKHTTLLIKGSRSAKMDVIVRELCEVSSHSTGEQP